ncbi:hypothetical protein FRB99_006219 [Tulasnella sp. 403]|nr:hypothetical protein FRB99_006219 [Tulasnella sp. 403]
MSTADFLAFSHKIQKLLIDREFPLPGDDAAFQELSKQEIRDMNMLLQGRALLPNLRDIDYRNPSFGDTVGMALETSSRIGTFKAYIPTTPHTPPPPPDRERLDLRDDGHTPASYGWWLMLSECKELRTLYLTLKLMPRLPVSHPRVSFHSLQSLTICSPSALWLLLHSTIPLLSELVVASNGMGSGGFSNLTGHLKQHSPYLKALSIPCLHVDSTFLMDDSIPALLADFKLRELSLRGVVDTTILPDDRKTFILEHWAPLLDNLDSFGFDLRFLIRGRISVATEETLVAILKCAKRLKQLRIAVDKFEPCRFVGRLEKECGRVPVPGLRYLRISVDESLLDRASAEEAPRNAFLGLRLGTAIVWSKCSSEVPYHK